MARLTHTILAAAFTGALSVSAAAAGQPQALGLVATADPVPMQCAAGTCRAVLSSFCLQQDHRSPSPADAYRMAAPDTVRLVGHDPAGRRIDLPTTSLQFRPAPEYTSIEVSFPEAALGVVNPNRDDDLSGQGHLCAAGVVFLALVRVSAMLRARIGVRPPPDLLSMLDLVAMATVCDVVPCLSVRGAWPHALDHEVPRTPMSNRVPSAWHAKSSK